MAAEFIKVSFDTPEKEEVLEIADILEISIQCAFGMCMAFWCFVSKYAKDKGIITSKRLRYFAREKLEQDFLNALIEVGWLIKLSEDLFQIPNFDRHLSAIGQARAQRNKRQKKYRVKSKKGGKQPFEGDWLMLKWATFEKAEIWRIGQILRLNKYEVVGKCVVVWIFANLNCYCDGVLPHDVSELINEKTNNNRFAEALKAVGWLKVVNGITTFPNFASQNGTTAKAREKEFSDKSSFKPHNTLPAGASTMPSTNASTGPSTVASTTLSTREQYSSGGLEGSKLKGGEPKSKSNEECEDFFPNQGASVQGGTGGESASLLQNLPDNRCQVHDERLNGNGAIPEAQGTQTLKSNRHSSQDEAKRQEVARELNRPTRPDFVEVCRAWEIPDDFANLVYDHEESLGEQGWGKPLKSMLLGLASQYHAHAEGKQSTIKASGQEPHEEDPVQSAKPNHPFSKVEWRKACKAEGIFAFHANAYFDELLKDGTDQNPIEFHLKRFQKKIQDENGTEDEEDASVILG